MRIQELRQTNDKGASAVEYTVLIALVAIALILVLIFLGQSVARAFMGAGEAAGSGPVAASSGGLCEGVYFSSSSLANSCDPATGLPAAGTCVDGTLAGDGTEASSYSCSLAGAENLAAAGAGLESQTPVCDAFNLNSPANGTCTAEEITCDSGYTLTDSLCVADSTPTATPTPTATTTPTPAPSIACSGSVSTKATQGSNTAPTCDTTTGTWQCASGALTDNGSSHWYCQVTAVATPSASTCAGNTYDPNGSGSNSKVAASCVASRWTCPSGYELKQQEEGSYAGYFYCKD